MKNLRNKVLLGVLIVIMFITICCVAIFYKKDAEMIQNDYCSNLYNRVRQTGIYFDDTMCNIYEISIEAAYDEALQALISEYRENSTEDKLSEIVKVLMEYKSMNSEISSICIYMEDKSKIITSEEYPMLLENTNIELGDISLCPTLIKEPFKREGNALSFINEIENENTTAYILVNIQERSVYYNYLDNIDDIRVKAIRIVDGNDTVISSNNRNLVGLNYSDKIFENIGNKGIIQDEGNNEIGISYKMPFSQFNIHIVVSSEEILTQLKTLRYFVLTLCLIFITVAFSIIYFCTKLIYKPLNRLTETVIEVGRGDLDKRYKVSTRDEVGTLGRNFNNMLDRINALFKQLIKEERLKKDAELEALQYQITPHFMFNTLNSIKCYALIKDEPEIADLIENFEELLQAVISKKGAFITLQYETDIVEKYATLQRFRNGDAFKVTYNISDAAARCYIPRLILQPFVENSIMHGFDMRNAGNEIIIEAWVREGVLTIGISDNGVGMTEKEIDILLKSSKKKTTGLSSIGIANVKERLQLYFGVSGTLSIQSKEKGISVIINMPAITEPEEVLKFDDMEVNGHEI